ncbi:MAG: DegV family protein [Oscillospiraceae bacterium]|nr:DegV family protein [Oscillospiraceae bacterium]
MERIAVMTDTNSGMTPEEARQVGVALLAMPFTVDGRACFEHLDISHREFYAIQAQGAQITSSQPAPADLLSMWDELLESNDTIIYIPMTSGLSGSCATACALAQDYDGRVLVVDNRRISVSLKQAVLEAVHLRDAGKTAAEIAARLEEKALESHIYITVEDLSHLKKSGRITPAVAAVGTVLNIKPVMKILDGKLDMHRKVRGMKQACQTMLEAVRADLEGEFAGKKVIVAAAYSGDEEQGREWAEVVRKEFAGYPFMCDPLPLSIGCHVGEGALGAAVFADYDM